MIETQEKNAQVISDGVTVWVNALNGHCIARFGRSGIDIHQVDPAADTECLYCTHAPTDIDDWLTFMTKVRELHGVDVPDKHRPTRFGQCLMLDRNITEKTKRPNRLYSTNEQEVPNRVIIERARAFGFVDVRWVHRQGWSGERMFLNAGILMSGRRDKLPPEFGQKIGRFIPAPLEALP